MNHTVDGPDVGHDPASETVTASGIAPDQATREEVELRCGNVFQAAVVNEMLSVSAPEPECGSPDKYPQIFEANKAMFGHPDKIDPGRVLRIPTA